MILMSTQFPSVLSDTSTDYLLVRALENIIWPILILSFVVFSFLVPEIFASLDNVQFILYASAPLGVLVLAESICLLSGNFDLSVAATAGFSAMFAALVLTQWFPGTPALIGILVVLTVGGVIGLLNGISIGLLGVNPFLQTLTFFIIFGEGTSVLSSLSISSLPERYLYLGDGTLLGVRVAVLVLLVLFVAAWVLSKYSRIGLAVYAVGGDQNAANEAGINTAGVIVLVYVVSGVLSGLAGLLYTGFVGTASPTLADGALFPAFAAAVIGGISLFGGRGNILGALGGVLLLSTIQSGLTLVQVDATLVRVINGVILLIAVLLYTGEERLRTRILSS
jgi:ribose/xylose/arabinose/galactoside ABC-type transport system permease subunit